MLPLLRRLQAGGRTLRCLQLLLRPLERLLLGRQLLLHALQLLWQDMRGKMRSTCGVVII